MSTLVERVNAHLLLLFLTESFLEQVMRDEITAEKPQRSESHLCRRLPLLQLHRVGFMVHHNCVILYLKQLLAAAGRTAGHAHYS